MSGALLLSDLPVRGRKENDETLAAVKAVVRQFSLMVSKLVFPADIADGVVDEYKAVSVTAQDVNSIRMLFADNIIKRVKVKVKVGGGTTATLVTLKNEKGELSVVGATAATYTIVTFTEGLAGFEVKADAGDVTLEFEDIDSSGLTMTDTIKVTFA